MSTKQINCKTKVRKSVFLISNLELEMAESSIIEAIITLEKIC